MLEAFTGIFLIIIVIGSILSIIIRSVLLYTLKYFLPGFKFKRFGYAFFVAIAIQILNWLVQSVLLRINIPDIGILIVPLLYIIEVPLIALLLLKLSEKSDWVEIKDKKTLFIGTLILEILGILLTRSGLNSLIR